ncbi:hypothetical protein HWQ46_01775 [Shewanella sp. D64]|uniref:hypothetical protein n=1 Tax=unclassified Shewanella TaxID=196818 RepID=UPI0022BA3B44|nr:MULTISPECIES: hypothetical protein [unclassified Shewanella]MEC4724276.1 hypothetical protein [Shewanella sp. D64]MEC4738788.1 hypothetical protein [Shewanella sp. E94]WBJ97772.1 hypothetical protein HWQ47_12080 [Shewanella sp. MTB7]
MLELLDSKVTLAVISAVLGLLSALFVQLVVSRIATVTARNSQRLEKLGMISAYRAEIRVYLRQLESNLAVFVKHTEKPELIGKSIAQSVFFEPKIYDAYIGQIGQLGPVYSEQIVRFYASICALRQTLTLLQSYVDSGNDASGLIIAKIQNQLSNSIQRAKITEAILSASMVNGLLTENKQLKIVSGDLSRD